MIFSIDFGTSNSLIALCEKGKVHAPALLEPEQSILKSILYFPNKNESYFGTQAIKKYTENDFQGRLLRSMKKFLPTQSFQGTDIDGDIYTLEQIIGSFLRELKTRAEKHYGQKVDRCLMGRPAKFSTDPMEDEIAETRLLQAATLAGFKDIGFSPEPLAAAYSYCQNLKERKKVLICDLGGGTSDFTLTEFLPDTTLTSNVLAIHGVPIAGDRIDGAYMRECIGPYFGTEVVYQMPMSHNELKMPPTLKYRLSSPADLALLTGSQTAEFLRQLVKSQLKPADQQALNRLFVLTEDNLGYDIFRTIENTKIALSTDSPGRFAYMYPQIEIEFDTSYEQLIESAVKELDEITKAMHETLSMAQLNPQDIDLVVCTGGTSYLPFISQYLSEVFGAEKIDTHQHFHSVIGGLSQQALEILEED